MFRKWFMLCSSAVLLAVLAVSAWPISSTQAASLTTVKGSINIVDPARGKINIKKADGTSVTLSTTSATAITRNGALAGLRGLVLGDSVTATYDSVTKKASKLAATGIKVTKAVGRVTGRNAKTGMITLATAFGSRTFHASSATKFVRNGRIVSFNQLARGDRMVVHTKAGTSSSAASVNEALDTVDDGAEEAEVEGTITNIDLGQSTVTITPSNGTPAVLLHVDANTIIEISDSEGPNPKTLADLAVGMQADAEYDPVSFLAFSIDAESNSSDTTEVSGTLTAVDLTGSTVTITPSDGSPAVVLTVNGDTEISVADEEATLADLPAQVGQPVQAEYFTASMLAEQIDVAGTDTDPGDNTAEVEGVASGVSPTGITVTPEGGSPVVLTIDGSTEIEVNGEPATIADVHDGDTVQAEYDTVTLLASSIEDGGD